MSPLEQILLQALLGAVGSIFAAVVGYVITRVISRKLRPLFASAAATTAGMEEMKARTDNLLTALLRDESQGATLATHDHRLDNHDRRFAALEQFARQLSAYAHGSSDLPTYTEPVLTPSEGTTDVQ